MSSAYRLLKLCLGLLCSSCLVVTDNSVTGDEAAGSGRTFEECEPIVDNQSQQEMAVSVERALSELQMRGIHPRDIWSEPNLMTEFMVVAHREAGCEVGAPGVSQQRLHDGVEPASYCGLGHGFVTATVSSCLNTVCMKHDACYARCSGPTGFGCFWNDVTLDCDEEAYAEADSCVDDSRRFRSFLVRILMRLLRSEGRGSCGAAMTCPGSGACQTDRQGSGCARCMAGTDPICLARACSAAFGVDCDTAALANCPDLGACFGSPLSNGGPVGGAAGAAGAPGGESTGGAASAIGGGGMSGAGGVGGQASNAEDQWSLAILGALIPDAKPDGLAWDLEGASVAPDPFVRVRTGSPDAQVKTTGTLMDTWQPDWEGELPVSLSTRGELETYVSLDLWDSDLWSAAVKPRWIQPRSMDSLVGSSASRGESCCFPCATNWWVRAPPSELSETLCPPIVDLGI